MMSSEKLPVLTMIVGMIMGFVMGVAGVFYFHLGTLLEQVCMIGISVMLFQLFGATVGAAVGKKHTD